MNNVLRFTEKRPTVAFRLVSEDHPPRENAIFLLGVVATTIAPVVSYCTNGGPVRPLVFATVAGLGTILGVIKYSGFFNDAPTVVSVGTGPDTSQNVVNLRKAA